MIFQLFKAVTYIIQISVKVNGRFLLLQTNGIGSRPSYFGLE